MCESSIVPLPDFPWMLLTGFPLYSRFPLPISHSRSRAITLSPNTTPGRARRTIATPSSTSRARPDSTSHPTNAAALREYPNAQQTSVGRRPSKSAIPATAAAICSTAGTAKSSIGTCTSARTANSPVKSTTDRNPSTAGRPTHTPSATSLTPVRHARELTHAHTVYGHIHTGGQCPRFPNTSTRPVAYAAATSDSANPGHNNTHAQPCHQNASTVITAAAAPYAPASRQFTVPARRSPITATTSTPAHNPVGKSMK